MKLIILTGQCARYVQNIYLNAIIWWFIKNFVFIIDLSSFSEPFIDSVQLVKNKQL